MFLKYTAGDQLGPVNMVSVKPLDAGEYYDLSVNMISPGKTGMYQGQWRMCTPTGQHFGGKVPPLMSRNAPNPEFGYFTWNRPFRPFHMTSCLTELFVF